MEKMIRRLRALLLRLMGFLGKRRPDSELSEELEAHLAMQIEDNIRSGMSADEARRHALVKSGGMVQGKELCRDRNRLPLIDTLLQDLRYSARMLRKNPAFAAIAIITLALGIGANTAVFSVVRTVLLKSLPYPDAKSLIVLDEYHVRNGEESVSWMDFRDWQAQQEVFDGMAAYRPRHFVLTGFEKPDLLRAGEVTSSFLSLLGGQPSLGRTFTQDDDKPGAKRTAVLSYYFWRTRLGGDPAILGRNLILDDDSYTVIGVLQPEFKFFQKNIDLYVAAGVVSDDPIWIQRGNHQGFEVLARLRAGTSLSAARSSMETIMKRLEQEYPAFDEGQRVSLTPLYDSRVSDVQRSLWVLLAGSFCVLLIACANVANLSLTRAATRARDFAIRSAIGARRSRLIRQLLTESIVLSLIGGLFGLFCAKWAIGPLLLLAPADIPRLDETRMDASVFFFTFAVALITGIIFGLAPALQSSRVDLTAPLREAGRKTSSGRSGQRLRAILLVAQISLAFVLVMASGLLIRSLIRSLAVDPGFKVDHLLAMDVNLPLARYKTDAQPAMFLTQTLARIRSLPGVKSASVVSCPPLVGTCWRSVFLVGGRPAPPPAEQPRAAFNVAEPGYFETMQIPLLAGRLFTSADQHGSPQVVLVNETMARRWWPNESAVGKKIKQGFSQDRSPFMEIVGVVGDLKQDGLDQPSWPEVFEPAEQNPMRFLTFVVRTSTDPLTMSTTVKDVIYQVDKDQPAYRVQSMDGYLAASLARRKFETLLLGIFSALALLLAAVGIYGLVAYMVTQRTYEIGIRMALGAQKHSVLTMVLRFGLKLATYGLALGLAVSLAVTRVLQSLLFGVGERDPQTFVGVTVLLTIVALVACYIPAHRATKVDPLVALRYE
ncbi:MAG TPA: ABC transporter permease [Candidatus Angelobacter sp.]